MSFLNELSHMPEEERKKQNLDMRAVDIGIGHDNDFSVTKLCNIEFLTDSAAERLYDRNQLRIGVNLVEPALLDIQNLTAHGQDRLKMAVTSVLCGTACGITLDKIQLGKFLALLMTVRKLAGKSRPLERTFSARIFPCAARRFSRAGSGDRFGDIRVFLEKFIELGGHKTADKAAHFGISELSFGLPFKLRFP